MVITFVLSNRDSLNLHVDHDAKEFKALARAVGDPQGLYAGRDINGGCWFVPSRSVVAVMVDRVPPGVEL